MSKLLKFQPDTVVGHILNNLKKATRYTGDLDWGTLLDQIIKLIPKTINEKMHLFFRVALLTNEQFFHQKCKLASSNVKIVK